MRAGIAGKTLARAGALCGAFFSALLLAGLASSAKAGDRLAEPAVFASRFGVLDLLIVAKPKPIETISFEPPAGAPTHPVGWVYEICPRPPMGAQCPAGAETVADYGGARLALQPGDRLKIRFVNRLPKLDPLKLAHAGEHGGANLALNPTNLHMHGLIVPARAPTPGDPTFGDYVFVSVFNPANGEPLGQGPHDHGLMAMDAVDYRIDIPKNHPSGLYWFHPHVHGLSLNQVSSGLAGILTIGDVGDYLRERGAFSERPPTARHLILKDLQVLAKGAAPFAKGAAPVANGEVLHQQDPDFCKPTPKAGEARDGLCEGADSSGEDGVNYNGGKWYFTINGQRFPTIPLKAPQGEIWRLTNASASVSYHLQLVDDATKQPIALQLVAVDGVSVSLPQDTPIDTIVRLAGARFKVARCPRAASDIVALPVCVTELVMMPSARAELWATYRDAAGRVAQPPQKASATLKTTGLKMGSGDSWPAVDLAKVEFEQGEALHKSALAVIGDALKVTQAGGIFADARPDARAAPLPGGCKALPPGHRRRIFFGLEDLKDESSFGLGYEEVDAHGDPVPGTHTPVARFDPKRPTICLPLGPGQRPVHELWELVQLSTENHNFHIHQTKFRTVDATAPSSSPNGVRPAPGTGYGILQDNLPLGVVTPDAAIREEVMNDQSGVCSIAQWRSGHCGAKPVIVDIPFSELGEFVYHCHILEHEDGGMMAKIRVVAAPR